MTPEMLNAIGNILWPVALIIFLILFRQHYTKFIDRILKITWSKGGAEVDTTNPLGKLAAKGEEAADALSAVAEEVKSLFHQGKPYDDYSAAFLDLEKLIEATLRDHQRSKSP